MKNLKSILVLTAGLILTGCASHSGTAQARSVEVVAKVISTEQAPMRCKRDDGNALAGLIVGGLIGNQFGSGGGRKAMTAVGAVAGAGIGANSGSGKSNCRYDGWISNVQYIDPRTGRLTYSQIHMDNHVSSGTYIRTRVR